MREDEMIMTSMIVIVTTRMTSISCIVNANTLHSSSTVTRPFIPYFIRSPYLYSRYQFTPILSTPSHRTSLLYTHLLTHVLPFSSLPLPPFSSLLFPSHLFISLDLKVADGVQGLGRGLGSFGAYLIGRGDFDDWTTSNNDREGKKWNRIVRNGIEGKGVGREGKGGKGERSTIYWWHSSHIRLADGGVGGGMYTCSSVHNLATPRHHTPYYLTLSNPIRSYPISNIFQPWILRAYHRPHTHTAQRISFNMTGDTTD